MKSPIVHLPHSFTLRSDRRVVSRLLDKAGIETSSELGAALADLLRARIDSWRDFFALRRGRMARRTLIVLAARSLADDQDAAAAIDALARGRGQALLDAIEGLVALQFGTNRPIKASAKAARAATTPVAVNTAAVISLGEVRASPRFKLREDRRKTSRAVPPATDRRREQPAPYFPERLAAA